MASSNSVSLPTDIGFTLESFIDMAYRLNRVTINVDQAEAIIAIICPKVYKYYHDFGIDHVKYHNIHEFDNTIDRQTKTNIKKIHRQLKAIVKTKYNNSFHVRKNVSIYIHGICQGHCKYIQTHMYEERTLETKEDEIIRVARILKNMTHHSTLQKFYLQYAVHILYPTKQLQNNPPSDVPKIKSNAYLRKKVGEYSSNIIISSDVLQYWNYIIFEINK
jgi:hypothetical protein